MPFHIHILYPNAMMTPTTATNSAHTAATSKDTQSSGGPEHEARPDAAMDSPIQYTLRAMALGMEFGLMWMLPWWELWQPCRREEQDDHASPTAKPESPPPQS